MSFYVQLCLTNSPSEYSQDVKCNVASFTWPCFRVRKWCNQSVRISFIPHAFEQAGMRFSFLLPLYRLFALDK